MTYKRSKIIVENTSKKKKKNSNTSKFPIAVGFRDCSLIFNVVDVNIGEVAVFEENRILCIREGRNPHSRMNGSCSYG